MKKLTGIAIVTTAEGKRIAYTYSELDDGGNVLSANNRGSFIALDAGLLAAVRTLETAAEQRL